MVDSLDQFIALDLPFLSQERQQRVAFLRKNFARSDLSIAEKFRQVLAAYAIESEYGRKINTYPANINIEGFAHERRVDILQVGRLALVFQTLDGQVTGVWDKPSRTWVTLDPALYRNLIKDNLRIAKQQATLNLMPLPIAAPEVVQ